MDRRIDPRETIEIRDVELARLREWMRDAGEEDRAPRQKIETSRDTLATEGSTLALGDYMVGERGDQP